MTDLCGNPGPCTLPAGHDTDHTDHTDGLVHWKNTTTVGDLQQDIASAILRIEQAYQERGTAFGELLLERLQADARRLRTHLTPEWRSRLEEAEQLL